ncbi:MAG: TSUP family transporter [Rhodobacterales bacterium]
MPPFWAVTKLIVMDVFGPVPNLSRAWRSGHSRALFVMAFGMVSALPLGLFLLEQMDPLLFRYLVATMALTAPLLLLMGFRFSAEAEKPPLLYVTGAFSGFLGGLVGIPGPPVIILYISSRLPVRIIRARSCAMALPAGAETAFRQCL